ncbi:MAG: acyl carrier protein [Bacteroidales bacterium]|jgi:acyl carrier protein|nr:acyl carrier protein [Bacteroidales bacterium]
MQRKDIEEKVTDFLIEELEVERELILAPAEDASVELLKTDALLKDDLGIDSLDFVDIVVIVEREFGFKPKPEEMADVRTLGHFIDYIESKVGA